MNRNVSHVKKKITCIYMDIKKKYKKKIITWIGNTDILEHSTLNINRDPEIMKNVTTVK